MRSEEVRTCQDLVGREEGRGERSEASRAGSDGRTGAAAEEAEEAEGSMTDRLLVEVVAALERGRKELVEGATSRKRFQRAIGRAQLELAGVSSYSAVQARPGGSLQTKSP